MLQAIGVKENAGVSSYVSAFLLNSFSQEGSRGSRTCTACATFAASPWALQTSKFLGSLLDYGRWLFWFRNCEQRRRGTETAFKRSQAKVRSHPRRSQVLSPRRLRYRLTRNWRTRQARQGEWKVQTSSQVKILREVTLRCQERQSRCPEKGTSGAQWDSQGPE